MKKTLVFSVFLLVILLLLPLCTLSESAPVATLPTQAAVSTKESDVLKVLLTDTNTVAELTTEDYLFGVLAGEMPALYEPEALKAQAVCAYTFALWRKNENTDKDYDITSDYTTDQCYITPEQAAKKWGSKADEYEQKLRDAIKAVKDEVLTYNGELTLSVYHSVSGGKTESAKNVWGKEYPYLQAVSSIGDKLATNYISTCSFSKAQIEAALSVTLPTALKGSFTNFSRTASGTVDKVTVGGTQFKGSEVRKALELKSSNFEVSLKDEQFTFTVYGYGHGVGMSQNGANYMAQQGSDYKEILSHYYTGCEVVKQ